MKKKIKKSRFQIVVRSGIIGILALLIGTASAGGLTEKSIGQIIDYVVQTVTSQEEDADYQSAEVVRVVDGDTIVLEVGGQEQKVRLIGINTPESVGQYKNNPEPGGKEAAEFMNDLLPPGRTVYLTSDVSDTDKYGRLLRYVWLEKPDESKTKDRMINCILLEKGYATLMTKPPDVKYVELFQEMKNRK